jgi:hypothetical protein
VAHRDDVSPEHKGAIHVSRDQVELIDCSIRLRAEGHEAVTRTLGEAYGRPFDDIKEALYGTDNYVVDTNESGDITGIEREVYDDSFGGDPVWDAIAPWVDEGDYLAYRETWDNRTYRILFDGKGGHVTEWGRITYGAD